MLRDALPRNVHEWRMLLGALARLLRDPDRLDDIHIVAEITARKRFEALLEEGRRLDIPILRERPEIDPDTIDFAWLRSLPPDTLGGAYIRHLDAYDLKLYVDPTSTRVIEDPDVGYLVHRYRQIHDIWHVLLGLGVEPHEEVLVHAFVLGMLGLPNSAMIVGVGGIQHILLRGRWQMLRRGLIDMWHNGRECVQLLWVPFEQLWDRPLDEVRAELGVQPCAVA